MLPSAELVKTVQMVLDHPFRRHFVQRVSSFPFVLLFALHHPGVRSFASSAPSGIVEQFIRKYNMSVDVATLTISLFVAGDCVGPMIWGPLSEQASQSTPGHAN